MPLDLRRVSPALLSVSDKAGLVDFATGFPEMMDGRVKTLHPKVPLRRFSRTRQAAEPDPTRGRPMH